MKFLRQFDTYLLEHHPILWHSKVVYLFTGGLLLWLLFFGAGYLLMDSYDLQMQYISNLYSYSYAALVHAILVLVGISLWALYFFKKNAVRHYYPLKHFYFTKLFLCLLLGFLPMLSVIFPFNEGVRLKARGLVSKEQLQTDARILNLALVFLAEGEDAYKLEERCYPAPFPLETIYYNHADEYWNEGHLYYKDSAGHTVPYTATGHPQNTVRIDDLSFQFFHSDFIPKRSECDENDSYYLIREIVVPDSSLALRRISVLNYSRVRFPGAYDPQDTYVPQSTGYYGLSGLESTREFAAHYAPTIHRWVHNDQQDSIVWVLGEFKKVLDRYDALHAIDAQTIARHFAINDYASFVTDFMDPYANEYDYSIGRYRRNIGNVGPELVSEIPNQSFFGYQGEVLERVYDNSNFAYDPSERTLWELFFGFLSFAIGLALVFLLFDFTNFIQFLIMIPVGGVLLILTILGVVLVVFASGSGYGSEVYGTVFAFSVGTAVFALSIAATLLRSFNKKVAGVLLNLGYLVAPFYLPAFVGVMILATRTVTFDGCHPYGHHAFNPFWLSLAKPEVLIPLGVLGSVCYFALIKRWYAKEE